MIDDAKIRRVLLERFPQIEPYRFEMEEFDYGDAYGAYWRSPDGVKRVQADARGKDEAQIADAIAEQMASWFKRPVGRPRKQAA
jgi:hypothetical protein